MTAPAPSEPQHRLSRTLRNSIALMVLVTAASVLLLLFGDFDGKVPRIASTYLVFAVFTLFAALDARDDGPAHRAPIAQVGNSYMLAITLTYTWGSLLATGFDDYWLLPKTLFLMLMVKAGIFLVQRLTDLAVSPQRTLSLWARHCCWGLP